MSSANPDTRTRILDTTWSLLESGGTVRMSDIAKAVGISRQAVYLHFPSRAELLIATTRHIDAVKDIDARLAPSRRATDGATRLEAFVTAWADYIPEIHGVGRALMSMQDTDAEAAAAWANRMDALYEGCMAAVSALQRDGQLAQGLTPKTGADLLWMLLSVRNWELLRREKGWSQQAYRDGILRAARAVLMGG